MSIDTQAPPAPAPEAPKRVPNPRLMRILRTAVRWVLAILGAMMIFSLLISFQGANPIDVFHDMLVATFQRPRSLTEIILRMAPIALAALAVVVPARAGMINVGGEGQDGQPDEQHDDDVGQRQQLVVVDASRVRPATAGGPPRPEAFVPGDRDVPAVQWQQGQQVEDPDEEIGRAHV